MSANDQPQRKRGLLIALVAGVFALVAVGVAALLVNNRRAQAGGKARLREARGGDGERRRRPLLQPNRACAGCHPYGDDELKARVIAIQDRHFALLTRAGQAAVAMIDAIVAVRKPYDDRNREAAIAKAKEALEKQDAFHKLAKDEQEKKLSAEVKVNLLAAWREVVEKDPALKELENLQRAAQWRLDYVAAENSMGFHAPQEMARILGESIDLSRQAQVKAGQIGTPTLALAAPPPPASVVPAAVLAKKAR